MGWNKLSREEIKDRIFNALKQNVDFYQQHALGVPGSHLDDKVFYQHAPFLSEAPFLTTLIHNPNHIGCHTLGKSEPFFRGTQDIERELISICSVDILNGQGEAFDGYVASGGTEANMQAVWIYRNYFMRQRGISPSGICIICSEDAHYSMHKAADVLGLRIALVPVTESGREITPESVKEVVSVEKAKGTKAFVVVANMMTTMFGSVDNPQLYVEAITAAGLPFKLHVDGAYGGFIYPFTGRENKLDYSNPHVSSVTLDAHKMVQAPYGTGIFTIRKGMMEYANTQSASYVEGEDYTLVGSRSGANAIAVWMILMTYGRIGWEAKMAELLKRTNWLCARLDEMQVGYYRNPRANIVTVRAGSVPVDLALRYGLVPDNHSRPQWYKIVVMDHVTIQSMEPLVNELKQSLGKH